MHTHATQGDSSSSGKSAFFSRPSRAANSAAPFFSALTTPVVQASCAACAGQEKVLQRQETDGEEAGEFHRFGDPPVGELDTAGGGSTSFLDIVNTPSTSSTGVVSGTVTRVETAPASDSHPSEEVSRGQMNISFDPSTCEVTIPFGFHFVQAAPSDPHGCEAGGRTPEALSPTEMDMVKMDILDAVNRGLNGWFDVQLSGRGCPSGCTGLMPIRVEASEDDSNPETITIVNRPGRSDAGTVCLRDWSDTTAVHEGGHQVLGLGDEYPESDESLRPIVPEWFRPERVRRDYSAMGPEQHTRFAMFHERHFRAVTAFLERVFPDCTATLVARTRPIIPDFGYHLSGGVAAVSGLPGFFLGLGLQMGIPLDRMRTWELTFGPEFTWLATAGGVRAQTAYLFGARLGIEGRTGDAGLGIAGGAFLSGGYGLFSSSGREAGAPYAEIGGRFGMHGGIGGVDLNLGLEGAAGTALGAPGIIGPAGPDILSDPARTYWFRVGLAAGVQF
jgi:hypothetical protein